MSIQNRFSDTTFNSLNRLLAVFQNKWWNCMQIIIHFEDEDGLLGAFMSLAKIGDFRILKRIHI